MTDDRLRALERRFRETGSVEDEAAWLRGRVRAGELEQELLLLAAWCGSKGARWVAGLQGSHSVGPDLVTGVVRLGAVARTDFALALARTQIDLEWEEPQAREHLLRVVAAAREWRRCPCDSHLGQVQLHMLLSPASRERLVGHRLALALTGHQREAALLALADLCASLRGRPVEAVLAEAANLACASILEGRDPWDGDWGSMGN